MVCVEAFQFLELTKFWGQVAGELVVVELERAEVGSVCNRWGYGS